MWFIIAMVVVVALIVGPIMMMRPGPVQRNKERLHAIAYAKGIRVSVRNLPQQTTEMEKPAPVPVYFFAPLVNYLDDDWFLLRTGYTHDIHFLGWWEWQGDLRPTDDEVAVLKDYLPSLPESVRAVSGGSKGVCVCWLEQGGDEALQAIISLLEALNALQIRPK